MIHSSFFFVPMLIVFLSQHSIEAGMVSLKKFAPPGFIDQLEKHAELTNVPRIGTDDNVAYPTVQVNFAPAVALEDSTGN